MLQFNPNGYLEPYEAIETDLAKAQTFLVWNEIRSLIWTNFEAFLRELQGILQSSFEIWLNGSFTTKKENPNDLDLVVFVDFQAYETHEKNLLQFKTLSYRKSQKLDVYFVKKYPENHKFRFVYELDRKEWLFAFSRTNPNKTKSIHLKGFFELKF